MARAHRPVRARRLRGDTGSATLETTGVWGLSAFLVAAVVLIVIAVSPGIGEIARQAFCRVLTLGQGDCSSAPIAGPDREPPEPCVLSANGHESKAQGAFTFVNASTGEQWLVEEMSDGTFRVTRGTGGSVGLEAGVGVTAQFTWDDKAYGVSAEAGVSAELGFTGGEVYSAKDQKAVDALLKQHGIDVAADNVVGNGPIRWAVDGLADLAGLDDYQLPDPQETYYEGGISAQANATGLFAGAKAGVGASTVLGVKVRRDGSTVEYLASTVSGEVAAGTWAGASDGTVQYAQVKTQSSVKQVIELERDDTGNVTAVRRCLITQGEAGATMGEAGPSGKTYTERVIRLPVTNPADRSIALSYLAASGITQVAGMGATPLIAMTAPLAIATAAAFNDAARARGQVTQQTFDAESSSYGGALGLGTIAEVAGNVTVNTTGLQSLDAQYWDGTAWQPWRACG